MTAIRRLAPRWTGSAWQSESTIHQLSPYIGKTKSSMARSLVIEFTRKDSVTYDPFSGCGTFAFEAWRAGRRVIANDLSPYASLLTRSKLFPYATLASALRDFDRMAAAVARLRKRPDLRAVPLWVRKFFQTETLREVIMWTKVLRRESRWFLLACLMGILHHQRPGFLSFPSSHTVPYLRLKRFPRSRYPKLYTYRSVEDRLRAKIERAFRRMPKLDFTLSRRCYATGADTLRLSKPVRTILSSPPYMRQLDYGRDNRLRLWFLGCDDWQSLDEAVSPGEQEFLDLMGRCLRRWRSVLEPNGYCVLVIGDSCSRENRTNLPRLVADIATKKAGYTLVKQHTDKIPNERRVRRGFSGSVSETILVLRNSRLRLVSKG
jgi:tRNA G10  N-methylase Trm11